MPADRAAPWSSTRWVIPLTFMCAMSHLRSFRERRWRISSLTASEWAGRFRGIRRPITTSTSTSVKPLRKVKHSVSAFFCVTGTMSIARTSPNDVVSRPSATSGRYWTSRRTVARRNGKTLLPVGRKPRRIRGGEDTTSIERKSGFSRPGLERMRRVLSGYVERKELPGLVAVVSHDADITRTGERHRSATNRVFPVATPRVGGR